MYRTASCVFLAFVIITLMVHDNKCNATKITDSSQSTKISGTKAENGGQEDSNNSNNSKSNQAIPLISLGILFLIFLGNVQSYDCTGILGGNNRAITSGNGIAQAQGNGIAEVPKQKKYRSEEANMLDEILNNLGNKNPGISDDNQIKVFSAILPTILGNARRPAVFLVLKPEVLDVQDYDVFVQEMALLCSHVYKNKGTNNDNPNPNAFMPFGNEDFHDKVIHHTFRRIQEEIENNDLKVLLFNDIDKIKTESFYLYLHSYCDNTDAPYKNVAFFFTATIPSNIFEETRLREFTEDRIRNAVFNQAWKDVEEDKRKALLARIGVNTIVLENKSPSRVS